MYLPGILKAKITIGLYWRKEPFLESTVCAPRSYVCCLQNKAEL